MIVFSKCCAKKSAEPISILAGDLNGCQVQLIVFPFDCYGAGRNQWQRTRQQLGLQTIRRGNGMDHTYCGCRECCMIINSMKGNTHNYSLHVTLEQTEKGSVAVEGAEGRNVRNWSFCIPAQEDFLPEYPSGWTCQFCIWQSRKLMHRSKPWIHPQMQRQPWWTNWFLNVEVLGKSTYLSYTSLPGLNAHYSEVCDKGQAWDRDITKQTKKAVFPDVRMQQPQIVLKLTSHIFPGGSAVVLPWFCNQTSAMFWVFFFPWQCYYHHHRVIDVLRSEFYYGNLPTTVGSADTLDTQPNTESWQEKRNTWIFCALLKENILCRVGARDWLVHPLLQSVHFPGWCFIT